MNKLLSVIAVVLLICELLSGCKTNSVTDAVTVGKTAHSTPIVEYSVDSVDWVETPDSTCFSEVGYDADNETLYVRFRSSGAAYRYLGFTQTEWNSFYNSNSLGTYYNTNIKGEYRSEKTAE